MQGCDYSENEGPKLEMEGTNNKSRKNSSKIKKYARKFNELKGQMHLKDCWMGRTRTGRLEPWEMLVKRQKLGSQDVDIVQLWAPGMSKLRQQEWWLR